MQFNRLPSPSLLPSSVAGPLPRNGFATPLEVVLPADVFGKISGGFPPCSLRLARQLNLVYHQEIQQPQFLADDKAFRKDGLPAGVVGAEKLSAGPKQMRKRSGGWIELVHRFVCKKLFSLLYAARSATLGCQYFEGSEGDLKGLFPHLLVSGGVRARHHQRAATKDCKHSYG